MLTQFYWPHLHPFFFCTLAYIAGILIAWVHVTPSLLLTLLCLSIVSFALFNKLSLTWKRTSCFIIFFIFFVIFNFYAQQYRHNQLATALSNKYVTLSLIVTDITRQNHSHNKYRILAQIDECLSVKLNCNKQIIIYTKNAPQCMVGDTIALSDVLIKMAQKESLSTYFIKEDLAGTLFYQTMPNQLIYRPQYCLTRFFHKIRERLVLSLNQKMSLRTFSYFSCLFLGNKKVSKINETLKEYCKYWGILHYLARSGLHLVLFAFSIDILLALIPLTYLLKNILSVLIFVLYFLLTWNSTSFMRSLLMVSLYKICFCFTRQIHVIHVLSLVTFFILWFNPIQLFFLDFQLSFGVTFLLALFNQIQKKRKSS